MSNKNLLVMVGFLLGLYVFVAVARNTILGGLTVVHLPSAPALSGQISQGLGPKTNGDFPAAGQDYSLSTHYFDGNTWVVASVTPLTDNLNGSVAVLQKQQGAYQLLLGPGTSFTKDQAQALPADVGEYLARVAAIYQPVAGQ